MIICKECVYLKIDNKGMIYCVCRENLREKFNPYDGLEYDIKSLSFNKEANKNGDCVWFKPKKKWWKTKTYINRKRFVGDDVDKFLSFVRKKYPEIVVEYTLLKSNGG